MPYYATSSEWLRQSQLLLEARPTTTRITTKYSIKVPKLRKPKDGSDESPSATTTPKPARGSLVLKTYDPVSGVALKYKTTKAAEVSRLVMCLGKLSRPMAGLPELKEEVMVDAPDSGAGTPALEKSEAAATGATGGAAASSGQQQHSQQGGGGKGKGKKKKGRK